jgi:hypothetical protein
VAGEKLSGEELKNLNSFKLKRKKQEKKYGVSIQIETMNKRDYRVWMPVIKNYRTADGRLSNASELITKVKNSKWNRFKNIMTISTLIKTINNMYSEKHKSLRKINLREHSSFTEFIYEVFLNCFGFVQLADEKFLIFILSLLHYQQHFSIAMFSGFLGLIEPEYSMDECNFYVNAIEFLGKDKVKVKKNNTGTQVLYPCTRVDEFIRQFLSNTVERSDYLDFLKEIRVLYKSENNNPINKGYVNGDFVMQKV